MTDKDLIRANKLKEEIDELNHFIWTAEKVWTGKIIKKDSFYIFKSNSYGVLDSAEYKLNIEMKDKVLDVLREHLKELKRQLEEI